MLVLHRFDQLEFFLQLRRDFFRHALRPARCRAGIGQLAQMLVRLQAVWHDFMRVLVFQQAHVECALRGDAQRFGEQIGRIDSVEIFGPAQMAFAIRKQRVPGLGNGAAEADRGHHVLQAPAPAHMHMHIAGGNQRQAMASAERLQARQFSGIVRSAMKFHGEPGASGKMLLYPLCVKVQRCSIGMRHRAG